VSEPVSGFSRALAALGEAGIDFVIVGVGGINFYARTPADAYATLDVDTFLSPAVDNLRGALSVLSGLGYEFQAGGEPFVDLDDNLVLRRIVDNGASLNAIHPEASELDLLTSISGFDYMDLSSDAATFEVAGATVRVGRLEKLLRSKEVSARPKDREFLRAFQARAFDDED
jgi:hypothetical protein